MHRKYDIHINQHAIIDVATKKNSYLESVGNVFKHTFYEVNKQFLDEFDIFRPKLLRANCTHVSRK